MIQCKEGLNFAERYELNRLLGRGGFSEVWLAKDIRTGVMVAVKIYAPGQGLDEEGITSFSQEFSLVFDMNHTNLLHPTHFDSWQGMPFLILPFCKNRSAFKYISEGKTMLENECWKLLHDTAAGLAYLHEKEPPIIHQDIKPDNILINDEGGYMITDFGISARVRHTLHQAAAKDQSSGTMAYMGPERFSKNPTPIMASDIWSLGAMLYELMTNDAPFGNFGGGMQKGGAEIPEIKTDYSQQLKDVVYKCLAMETWDRPSARQLQEYAYAVIHGLPAASFRNQNVETDTVLSESKEASAEPEKNSVSEPKPPNNQEGTKKKGKKEIRGTVAIGSEPQKNVQNSPNVKVSQPLKSNGFLSTAKGKGIVGGGVVLLIVICILLFSGGGGEVNEEVYVNSDSLKVDSLARQYTLECSKKTSEVLKNWKDENDLQSDSIEKVLLNIYSECSKYCKEVDSKYPSLSVGLKTEMSRIHDKLDSISNYLDKKASDMERFDQPDLQKAYLNRKNVIDSIVTSK